MARRGLEKENVLGIPRCRMGWASEHFSCSHLVANNDALAAGGAGHVLVLG